MALGPYIHLNRRIFAYAPAEHSTSFQLSCTTPDGYWSFIKKEYQKNYHQQRKSPNKQKATTNCVTDGISKMI
jgi:hypothetical protein